MKTTVITITEVANGGIVGVTLPDGSHTHSGYSVGEWPLAVAAGLIGGPTASPAAPESTGRRDQLAPMPSAPAIPGDLADGLAAKLAVQVESAIKAAEEAIASRVVARVLRAVAKCASEAILVTESEHPAQVNTGPLATKLNEAAAKAEGRAAKAGKESIS